MAKLSPNPYRKLFGALFGLAAWWALLASASAQNVSVETTIAPKEAQVGQSVIYQVIVRGSGMQISMDPIKVPDGIDMTFRGRSNSTQFSFGPHNAREDRIAFQWIVQAQKAGSYTIPAFNVTVDGRKYTAEAATFTVIDVASSSPSASGTRPNVWAEFKLDRPAAFVGEMVPAHLNVYFDRNYVRPLRRPDHLDVNLEGFTVQDWQPEDLSQVSIDGRAVLKFGFSTAISPAKPGKFKLPPISTTWIVQMSSSPRRSSPLDDDFFGMGHGLLGDFMNQRQLPVSTDEVEFEVLPLPEKGKPESFSGAIGKFGLEATVSPRESKTGEPLTLRTQIVGQGNFGRVNAPWVKEDPATWKTYAPTSHFEPADALGIEGAKSFEQLIIPQRATTTLPEIEFSYFDPYDEKYMILKPQEIPLAVVGAPLTTAPDESPADAADAKPETITPTLVPLITEFPGGPVNTRPLFQSPAFWLAQGVPAALLLAFLAMTIRRHAIENPSAKKQEHLLRNQLSEAEKQIDSAALPPAEVYAAARQALQLRLELASGQPVPDSQLEERLRAQPGIEGELREDLESFFERQAEVTYSGHGPGQSLPQEERAQLLEFTRRIGSHLK